MENMPTFAAVGRVRSHGGKTLDWLERLEVIPPQLANRLYAHLPFVCRERDIPAGVTARVVMTDAPPYLKYHLEVDSRDPRDAVTR